MKHFTLSLLALAALSPLCAKAYDNPYVGETKTIQAQYEDTLSYLARDHNLGYLELILANPNIDPWIPGEGTDIILPSKHILPDAPHEGIVINLAEMRLYAFLEKDKAPVTFPIGIGREGLETPKGKTTVTRKVKGPTWTPTARMREENPDLPQSIGPGPDNPLGTHALYLGWPQYLIHGTTRPFGIGRRISSGCMRMYPENIKELFDIIPVGTKVNVVEQPLKLAWIDQTLYLESHPNMTEAAQVEEKGLSDDFTLTQSDKDKIIGLAGDFAEKLNWDDINAIAAARSGVPMPILTIEKTHIETEANKEKSKKKETLPKATTKAATHKNTSQTTLTHQTRNYN